MATRLAETMIQLGNTEHPQAKYFSEGCVPGDWQDWTVKFPQAFPHTKRVRVFLSPTNAGLQDASHHAATVGIVREVQPDGFTLAARNSDCADGSTSFNWMALMESPGTERKPHPVRVGAVQPKFFEPQCRHGDWQQWDVRFKPSFTGARDAPGRSFAFVTASNLHVSSHQAAAVGLVRNLEASGFCLAARSSDTADGRSGFYYVALAADDGGQDQGEQPLQVDSGVVSARAFHPHGTAGDWRSWEVYFRQPFLTPPIVLLTANDVGRHQDVHNAAVVGAAQHVTPYGFTLAARNSDCHLGQTGFFWVAFGHCAG